jgi:hypothetical protein
VVLLPDSSPVRDGPEDDKQQAAIDTKQSADVEISDHVVLLSDSSPARDGPENDEQHAEPIDCVQSADVEVINGESKPDTEILIECLTSESETPSLEEAIASQQSNAPSVLDDHDGTEIAERTLKDQKATLVELDSVLGVEEISEENEQNDVKNDVNDDIDDDVNDDVQDEQRDVTKEISSSLHDVEEHIDRKDNCQRLGDHVKQRVDEEVEAINKTKIVLEPTEASGLEDDVEIDTTSQQIAEVSTEIDTTSQLSSGMSGELDVTLQENAEVSVEITTPHQNSEGLGDRRFLYRLLRPGEEYLSGISPKNSQSSTSAEMHVASGSSSNIGSKYVSCSKSLDSVKSFAYRVRKAWRPQMRYIVQIDRSLLGDDVEEIDLTKDEIRDNYLTSSRSDRNARRFNEVLLVPKNRIPPTSITKIARVQNGSITMI